LTKDAYGTADQSRTQQAKMCTEVKKKKKKKVKVKNHWNSKANQGQEII
jgi:hypothetical protein